LEKTFYSGFVSIIGRPNVGKSTLLNALAGEKVAIVSNKPQTTRNKIQAVLTREDFQAVFIDTPGIHGAKRKLDAYMQKSVDSALKEIDIVLFLTEPSLKTIQKDAEIIERFKSETPVFLLINKIDKVKDGDLLPVIDAYRNLFNFTETVPV
jgi:GTP-binding protein Era